MYKVCCCHFKSEVSWIPSNLVAGPEKYGKYGSGASRKEAYWQERSEERRSFSLAQNQAADL